MDMRDLGLEILMLASRWKLLLVPAALAFLWALIVSFLDMLYTPCEQPASGSGYIPIEMIREPCINEGERNFKIVNTVFGFLVSISTIVCIAITLLVDREY